MPRQRRDLQNKGLLLVMYVGRVTARGAINISRAARLILGRQRVLHRKWQLVGLRQNQTDLPKLVVR